MGWKSVDWVELAQDRDKWRVSVNAVMGRNSRLAEELLDSREELSLLDLAVLTRQEWRVCVCVPKRRCALLHWPNAGESISRGLHALMLIPHTDRGTVTGCQLTWTEDSLCMPVWWVRLASYPELRSSVRPFHTLRCALFSLHCAFPRYPYLQGVSVNMLCALLSSLDVLCTSRPSHRPCLPSCP
jgi:hypothetical protein